MDICSCACRCYIILVGVLSLELYVCCLYQLLYCKSNAVNMYHNEVAAEGLPI